MNVERLLLCCVGGDAMRFNTLRFSCVLEATTLWGVIYCAPVCACLVCVLCCFRIVKLSGDVRASALGQLIEPMNSFVS